MLRPSRRYRLHNLFTIPSAALAGPVSVRTDGPEPAEAEATIAVRGLLCALCAARVQRSLAALPGVVSARCDLESQRAVIVYAPSRCSEAALVDAVTAATIAMPLRRLLRRLAQFLRPTAKRGRNVRA